VKALGSRSRRAHSHHVQPCSLSNRLPAPSCEITSSSAVCRVSAIDSCVEIFATSACIGVVCAPVSCVCSLFAASVAAVRRVNELSTTTRCCDTKLSAVLKAVVVGDRRARRGSQGKVRHKLIQNSQNAGRSACRQALGRNQHYAFNRRG